MISAFLPLILLAYATVEAEGTLALLPCTFAVLWVWVTLLAVWVWLPDWLEERQGPDGPTVSFLTVQAVFQWGVVLWIIALQALSAPGRLLFPALARLLPQAWPMLVSTGLYVWLHWLSRGVFQRAFRLLLHPDQSPGEFFRARLTLPILFFPPMLLWMVVEDLWLGRASFSGISDLQTFVLAPLFFVGLYLLSPHLFNLAWRATPMADADLQAKIIALAERVETPISGVRVWDTFKEPIPNAAVAGLSARFRFVYITQYLLDLFPPREILAIIAHELGHLRLGHVWTYLFFSLDLVFLSLWLKLELFFRHPWLILRYESLESTVDLVVFLAVFLFLFTRLTRRSELEADRFAAAATDGAVFAGTLRVLQEFITPPSTWTPRWLLTHPEFEERIEAALSYHDTVTPLVERARWMRGWLLAVGVALLALSWPSARQVMILARAASAIKAGEVASGLAALRSLRADVQEHPIVVELLGAAAARQGRWPLVGYFAALRAFENLGRLGPPLEVFEHAAAPEVALHFQIVQFLLQALDLRRVHGVSLFDEILDHVQIALGQR
ncbi:MAG: Zn-dependent protease with chaperone function [Candidatus Ozemobacter sibiricus]|uniref:Zn-dependent protease with chaperone function n=1 Tax=Candidatus Ozemobacter sibiricus TaxID=2268124 RepID=A0A367ZNE2_9BACT|nr:MAG: Zn-dependent protease with chaperone function [Candidatus Ozemobacter sibiricus]